LEGLPQGEGCPHLRVGDQIEPAVATLADTSALDTNQGGVDEDEAAAGAYEWVDLGGAESLTLSEANNVAARAGCDVVLVAGEFESGKTTLLVELYAQFLHGPVGNWEFGGSSTLAAFDRRHLPAREASGEPRAHTKRTEEEDMRFLHMRLGGADRHVDLMLSDVRGELFENVVDGADVADQIPVAARADKCVVLIDGRLLADHGERARAMYRARLLCGGLMDVGGVARQARIAVVVSKADLLGGDDRSWVREQIAALEQFWRERGFGATGMELAARPEDPLRDPEGLKELLEWLVAVSDRSTSPSDPPVEMRRQFWRPDVAAFDPEVST